MDNVIVLNEEQFQDAIYKAVSRCLDERNIDMTTNSSSEDVFYSRDELPQFGIKIVHKKVGSLINILYLYR